MRLMSLQTLQTLKKKGAIRKYYEQLCTHKFCNLNEMDPFLEKYKLLQLIQYEIDNMNSNITIKG